MDSGRRIDLRIFALAFVAAGCGTPSDGPDPGPVYAAAIQGALVQPWVTEIPGPRGVYRGVLISGLRGTLATGDTPSHYTDDEAAAEALAAVVRFDAGLDFCVETDQAYSCTVASGERAAVSIAVSEVRFVTRNLASVPIRMHLQGRRGTDEYEYVVALNRMAGVWVATELRFLGQS